MTTDPIVQEVRDARALIAAEFGYDLPKYLAWIREQTRLRKDAGEKSPEMVEVPAVRKRQAKTPGRTG